MVLLEFHLAGELLAKVAASNLADDTLSVYVVSIV